MRCDEVSIKPFVSIGMPVYNGERYIKYSIDSILSQKFDNFELMISDNASTDGTESICKDYMKMDPRVKYHRFASNFGASKNYNYLYRVASGKYFRWSNDDDLWDSENLGKCVDVLENDRSVVLSYPKTKIIDENGVLIRKYDDNLDLQSPDPVLRFREFFNQIGLSNVLYGLMRTEDLGKTSLFGNYIGSDIVLIGELTLYGKFQEIPEYLFSRRFHSKSSSSDKSTESQQSFFDPKTIGKPAFPHLRHPYQYARAIMKSPLRSIDKMKLLGFLSKSLIRDRDAVVRDISNNIKRFRGERSSVAHKKL